MFNKGYIAINPKEIENYENEIIIAFQRINIENAKEYESYEDISKELLVEIWHYDNGKRYKNQLDYLYREKELITRYIQAYKKDTKIEEIKKDLNKKGYINIKTAEELRLNGIKTKGRGKDKKPRIRRTKEQMIFDETHVDLNIKIEKSIYELLIFIGKDENGISELVNASLRDSLSQQKEKIISIFEKIDK